jgi:preprotein translocase subunit SecB
MQSLLNIYDFTIEELHVKANEKYRGKGKDERAEIETTVSLRRKAGSSDFLLRMRIEVNRTEKAFAKGPYYVLLDISGFLGFVEGTEEETIQKMIGINGPVILYGVARGIVAQATANARHGKFVLPTVNFLEAAKQKPVRKNKTRQKSEGS